MFLRKLLIFCAIFFMATAANAASHGRVSKSARSAQVTQSAATGLVNINKADAGAFEAVKGIGPKKAQAIVDYREANGSFKSVDDLTNVKGIGPKQLEKLARYLTV